MTISLNPTKLNQTTKPLFNNLLNSVPGIYHKSGFYQVQDPKHKRKLIGVHLTHPIVIGSSKHNPAHKRVEVLGPKIAKGSYGKLFDSLGVIHSEKDMHFKIRKDDERIVVKLIRLIDSDHETVQAEEKKINECSTKIKCKPSLFNNRYGFLRMTRAKGIPMDDLIDLMHEGRVSLSLLQLLKLSDNLIRAVHDLHKQGWIHRDIKPNNIIIDIKTLEVTLIDFDFCCKKGFDEEIKGNWYYLAPEYNKSHLVTRKIDWFSMGLTLAELWGDRSILSFNSEEWNLDDANSWHQLQSFLDLFHCLDIPEEIQHAVQSALQDMILYDPNDRYQYKQMHKAIGSLIKKVESPDFDPEIANRNCVKRPESYKLSSPF